jgi:Protein of unknown function (DUF3040)
MAERGELPLRQPRYPATGSADGLPVGADRGAEYSAITLEVGKIRVKFGGGISMLNEHERRALREIELTVASDDPALAALFSPRSDRARYWQRLAYDLVAALSIVLGLVCIPLGQVGAGFVALVFAALVISIRRRRFPGYKIRRPARRTTVLE